PAPDPVAVLEQEERHEQQHPHPEDRRSVMVEAVPEALGRIAALYAGLDARSRRLMSEFTPEQLATVHAFLVASHQIAVEESDLLTG
ncbi:hypothetical protein ACWEPC_48880, partial [Nonomuraea sp. NPDC004297]